MTSHPSRCRSSAATEESTPPLIAARIRVFVIALSPACGWYSGDIARSLSTTVSMASTAYATSSSVFPYPRENRSAPWESVGSAPIAARIGDPSIDPEVQAEPEEQAIPIMSRFSSSASPSTNRNEILTVFGSRRVG